MKKYLIILPIALLTHYVSAQQALSKNGSIISTLTTNYLKVGDVVYPNTNGNSGQVLSTNGEGSLNWVEPLTAVGPQGPAGNDGLDGATGPMGPQGMRGIDGMPGTPGMQGPAGNDGLDGATGPMGPQGPAGNDGLDGATGPMGPQGPAGNDGLDGATGPMGPQGPAGNDGLDGATGPMGPQGPAGNDGLDGATGPMGPQGPTGANATLSYSFMSKTYDYSITAGDVTNNLIVKNSSNSVVTFTLPSASAAGVGKMIYITSTSTSTPQSINVLTDGSDLFFGFYTTPSGTTDISSTTLSNISWVQLISDGTSWNILGMYW